MRKIQIEYHNGMYSATPLLDDEVNEKIALGYRVVDISEQELHRWEDHLKEVNIWHQYWKNVYNNS